MRKYRAKDEEDLIKKIESDTELVKWGQGVENPHAFKHEMNRTPCNSAEMFQGTDCRSIKHEPHNSQKAGIFHTNPKPQQTLRASALSSLHKELEKEELVKGHVVEIRYAGKSAGIKKKLSERRLAVA